MFSSRLGVLAAAASSLIRRMARTQIGLWLMVEAHAGGIKTSGAWGIEPIAERIPRATNS